VLIHQQNAQFVHRHAKDAHCILQRKKNIDEVTQVRGGILDRDDVR
jgi:hypothetical protein